MVNKPWIHWENGYIMFGDNMGYTHYFEFLIPSGRSTKALELCYQSAVKDCAKIAREYNALCKAKGDDMGRLSGFSAHTKPGEYGGLEINGKEHLKCEAFTLREHFKQNFAYENDTGTFNMKNGLNFCKTRQFPYDVVVTACLAVLKQKLGNAIRVTSDGDAEAFQLGTELARKILKRKVPNPLGEVFKDKFERTVNED